LLNPWQKGEASPCRVHEEDPEGDLAKKLKKPEPGGEYELVPPLNSVKATFILVEAKDMIAGDGEVIAGAALGQRICCHR